MKPDGAGSIRSANGRQGDARSGIRLGRLRQAVEKSGTLHLRDAARLLDVSEMTVRRDLSRADGALTLLGGYIVATQSAPNIARYVLDQEVAAHAFAKKEAGRHAAHLVEDGDTLFIDCGTTTPYLAEALPTELKLTVVCYSMNIANLLIHRPRTRLLLLGGLYHDSSASFYAEEAVEGLSRIGINKAFLSAGGVHATRGATCSNLHEVPVKQAVLAQAEQRFLVVDGSKFGRLKMAFFAGLDAFDRIVTDASAPEDPVPVAEGRPLLDIAAAP